MGILSALNPLSYGRKQAAAWNALMAAYTFSLLSEADRQVVIEAADKVARRDFRQPFAEVVKRNSSIVAHNFLTYAFMELGIRPALGPGLWFQLRNPFIASIGAEDLLDFTRRKIEREHGIKLPEFERNIEEDEKAAEQGRRAQQVISDPNSSGFDIFRADQGLRRREATAAKGASRSPKNVETHQPKRLSLHSTINSWLAGFFLFALGKFFADALSKVMTTWLLNSTVGPASAALISAIASVGGAIVIGIMAGRFLGQLIPLCSPVSNVLVLKSPTANELSPGDRGVVTIVLLLLFGVSIIGSDLFAEGQVAGHKDPFADESRQNSAAGSVASRDSQGIVHEAVMAEKVGLPKKKFEAPTGAAIWLTNIEERQEQIVYVYEFVGVRPELLDERMIQDMGREATSLFRERCPIPAVALLLRRGASIAHIYRLQETGQTFATFVWSQKDC